MQQYNPHNLAHLKYISLLNVKVLRLIHENKLNWASELNKFKNTIKKTTSYNRTIQ